MVLYNSEDTHVLAFNIDTLVRSGDGMCDMPSATHTITTLRKLGAKSIVVTAESEASAANALDNAGLAVDALYAERRTPGQKAKVLAQVAVWAYLGNDASDMRAARTAKVYAVGVTSDRRSARQLRRAGADTVVEDLAEFPSMFRFSATSTDTLLTTYACSVRLGRDQKIVTEWVQKGWIPAVYDAWGRRRHPGDYINQLLAFTRQKSPDRHQALFVNLGWTNQNGTFDARKHASTQVYDMQTKGEVYSTQQISSLLGYDRHVIARWATEGYLPYITVGGHYYARKLDVKKLKKTMDGLSSYEAADALGVSNDTVIRMAKLGRLTVGGRPHKLRFNPKEIAHAKQQRDERAAAWLGSRASEELGIKNATLWKWGNRGIVPFHESNGQRLYDPEDIAQLKQKRNQINEGFEWVADTAKTSSYTPKQAGKRLGLRPKTLHTWAAVNALPFYNLVPQQFGRSDYNFVSAYIDALVAYAGSLPVTRREAREFYEICKTAGNIVTQSNGQRST